VLQILTLFDWDFDWERKDIIKTNDKESRWSGFSIPVSLRIIDDIFESPHYHMKEGQIEEVPEFYIHLDKRDLEKLKTIVDKAQNLLENVKECKWGFLDIALGYLAKAFFAERLDQLLWHMTVLEALLGEKERVKDSIKKRVSYILGEIGEEKSKTQKEIGKLYDFRCDLVHGNVSIPEVFQGDLKKARSYARKTLIWFLSFLSIIDMEMRGKGTLVENYPQRKDLLFLLDSENLGSKGTKLLLETLPGNFPNIETWDD
jgi:hypothetical protein